MLRNLATTAVFATLLLAAHDQTPAQTIGSNFGSSGSFGAGPVVPWSGIGGTPTPLPLSNDPTALNLRGTLPVIQSPELNLPADSESANGVNGQPDQGLQDTPTMPGGLETSLDGDDRQNLGKVNDFAQQAAVAVSGGGQDDEGDDDDPEEGDTPWWVWLLIVAGVAMVVSRLRRGANGS